jgi:hypothetical protein
MNLVARRVVGFALLAVPFAFALSLAIVARIAA